MAVVTGTGWVEPRGGELGDVAPTTANALIECPRRVAYARDPRTSGLARVRPKMALGTVAHRLTERVLKGSSVDGPGRRAWLESVWDELIAEEIERIQHAWPGRVLPDVEHWPGYVATRTRLLRRLEALDSIGRHGNPGPGRGFGALPWIERKLADAELHFFGTPDLVEVRDQRLRVVDLKTGVHQGEIRPGQMRQLLLYAHLVQLALARAVDEVAVVDVRGREQVVSITGAEVISAVRAVTEARDSYEALPSGRAPRATPTPDGCSRCAFRVVCAPFWSARQPDWPGRALAGEVTAVHIEGVVDVGEGDSMERLVLTDGVALTVGDEVAAVDLDGAGPRSARMRWDSSIRVNEALP